MRRLTWVFILIGVLAGACGTAETSVDAQARSIAARVWSPYCPGRLLADCTTRQSDELRAEIADRLERGQSEEQVVGWIRDNHGDAALAEPAGGTGLLIWLVPAAIFIAGGIVVTGLLRRWRQAEAPASPPRERRAVASDEALDWLRSEVEREP